MGAHPCKVTTRRALISRAFSSWVITLATLLPTPEIQIIDQNGNPLESGSIETLVPGTTTPKPTWQDADQTILNTNPIVLDAAGRAIVYGSGIYRWIVRDSAGNLVFDQLTADTSTGGLANGGVSTGSANAQVIAASSFSQQDGQAITFIAGATNTGAMTVAPGGGAGIPVLLDSSSGPVPLSGGEVVEDNEILLIYEAARGAFHLINPAPGTFINASISNSTITTSVITDSQIVLKQSTDPAPTGEGDIQWSTLFDNLKVGDGVGTKRFFAGPAPGLIFGCTIANNASDSTNDIDFAQGVVSDSTNAFYLTLSSSLTKRLDATWAVGNNQGGLFSGSIANSTYHCFIIMRPDTGVVDAGFDTSPIAANRPGSYTYFRRVGSIVRSGGTILQFIQTGDDFFWNTTSPPTDLSQMVTRVKALLTITVPSGIRVKGRFESVISVNAGSNQEVSMILYDGANPNINVYSQDFHTATSNTITAIPIEQYTNTSAQIYVTITGNPSSLNSTSLYTLGWVDTRGRT